MQLSHTFLLFIVGVALASSSTARRSRGRWHLHHHDEPLQLTSDQYNGIWVAWLALNWSMQIQNNGNDRTLTGEIERTACSYPMLTYHGVDCTSNSMNICLILLEFCLAYHDTVSLRWCKWNETHVYMQVNEMWTPHTIITWHFMMLTAQFHVELLDQTGDWCFIIIR